MTNTAITVGNFDGIHLGHIHLIQNLKEIAHNLGLKPLVVTFEPHPVEVLSPLNKFFCKLSTAEEKRELIEKQLGVEVEIIPFTKKFSQISPEEFLEKYLLKRFKAKAIVVGYDWKFGKNAVGNFLTLKNFCLSKNCIVKRIEPYKVADQIVSSSLIREKLKKAQLKEASNYLGHYYWISRKIVKGKGLGKKIGFPTLNFKEVEKLCLPNGVYAVYCNGYPAIANLGFAPTLKGYEKTLEVHILKEKFTICNKPRIVFIKYLRSEKAFKTVKELIKQIEKDIELAKNILLST